MAIFSIFVREGQPEPEAVGDRFSWFAALLPPVYALTYGLWLVLVLYALAVTGLFALGLVIGDEAAFWLYVLMALVIGFEAGAFRRAALRRRSYAHAGERVATDSEAAARAWLSSH